MAMDITLELFYCLRSVLLLRKRYFVSVANNKLLLDIIYNALKFSPSILCYVVNIQISKS